ncbi:MAG TPA: beta-ketoacyl-ACP synthase III [Burkholderiales bacterium]|jgi:3-oxoacyl-[acyl-carrier-protein] synthase-3|nr:beta-ketoacyl-ACP synthase III [Burkholderiales bacterium]
MNSRIIGTGSHLPEKVLTNADLEKIVDTSDEWIRSRTGISSRHIAAEGELTSDLALPAAQKALQSAGVAAGDIDMIIVATTTPDMIFPSTACILQSRLGIAGCPAFDLQAVCSGFVYALSTADLFIRAGQAKKVLVVGAEVYSRILDWNDRGTCVLFGDGAGAVVLAASDTPGILATRLHADGSHKDHLSVPGSVCGGKVWGRPFVHMDGGSVFRFAVRVFEEVAHEVLDQAGLKVSDLDWFVPHQANIRIMEATAKKLRLPVEKIIATVDHHGNTSAASIPLALDEAVHDGRIRPGQTLLLEGVGGGFTWGAVLLRW